MRRSDELLSQMMPKSVAQIKEGASAVETCEIFEMVTIVFNDIPMFGDICAQCDGMQIVGMLNNMFGMFDVLSDKNQLLDAFWIRGLDLRTLLGAPDAFCK